MDLETSDAAIISGDILGTLEFRGLDATVTHQVGAKILAKASATWDGAAYDAPTNLLFYTQSNGTNDDLASSRMIITSAGLVGIGTAAPTYLFQVAGIQPADVATTPGTNATDTIAVTLGIGGTTTIATTGVGGIGAAMTFTGGAGGVASSAAISSTGGAGGTITIQSGTGGAAAVAGTGSNSGGDGGAGTVRAGTGGRRLETQPETIPAAAAALSQSGLGREERPAT